MYMSLHEHVSSSLSGKYLGVWLGHRVGECLYF